MTLPNTISDACFKLIGLEPYYMEEVTDAVTGQKVLQCRIRADLPASLIHKLTLVIGKQFPVEPPSIRFGHSSTILEWSIRQSGTSVSSPTPSHSNSA